MGLVSILGYVLSTSFGDAFDFAWSCHVGLLLVGAGLLVRGARMSAVAFLWILLGFSLWGIDVINGRSVDAMTLAVHGGGLVFACFGVWRRGWPEQWVGWIVILGYLALQHGCRYVTPPEFNVNLAFGIRKGWEGSFDAYWPYWGLVTGGGSAYLLVCEAAARRIAARARGLERSLDLGPEAALQEGSSEQAPQPSPAPPAPAPPAPPAPAASAQQAHA